MPPALLTGSGLPARAAHLSSQKPRVTLASFLLTQHHLKHISLPPNTVAYELCAKQPAWHFIFLLLNTPYEERLINPHFTYVETRLQTVERT